MKSLLGYIEDLFKRMAEAFGHIRYLKRRAELSDRALILVAKTLANKHPELAESIASILDTWGRDLTALNKEFGHDTVPETTDH